MVVRDQWGWSNLKAGAFLVFFLTIDLAFFFANLAKVPHGYCGLGGTGVACPIGTGVAAKV